MKLHDLEKSATTLTLSSGVGIGEHLFLPRVLAERSSGKFKINLYLNASEFIPTQNWSRLPLILVRSWWHVFPSRSSGQLELVT